MKFKIIIVLSFTILFSSVSFAKESCRCLPKDSCWPKKEVWNDFQKKLSSPLLEPQLPIYPCQVDSKSQDCAKAMQIIDNPFAIEEQVGGTQSLGYHNAWKAEASTYAVKAQNEKDVQEAVQFAKKHNLKVVIKGAGHDYLGRSNAKDSLLIWTHAMRQVTLHDSYKPEGCDASKAVPAVTVEAGTRWLEAYSEVTTKNNRYVQGGGCTSVGAAGGFPQGGGFGSWSKKYGTGAGGIVEARVVTADGELKVANACQNQDLFWALKGGGGGTFGVVTKLTLMTHDLPETFGIFIGNLKAKNDTAFKETMQELFAFAGKNLMNEHWGEKIQINQDNSIDLTLVTQGLNKDQVTKTWASFVKWVGQQKDVSFENKYISIPAQHLWDLNYLKKNHPELVHPDPAHGEGTFWWKGDHTEVSFYWYAYQGRYVPKDVFEKSKLKSFVDVLYKASKLASYSIHINKGLAGATKDAIDRNKSTSMNPAVFNSTGLLVMAAGEAKVYPGIDGHKPNSQKAKDKVKAINKAMDMITKATPTAGAYANEADYFQKDWQNEFWGSNYKKLLKIKNKYDPDGLFQCHHCVGSESWDAQGLCKI